MNKRLLGDALKIALDYLPKHPEFANFPHWSFIVQNNKIIEWDTNSSNLPHGPFFSMYQSRVAHLDGTPKSHAEFNAYNQARGLLNRDSDFEIINIRLNKAGELRNSCPCECCMSFLRLMGCKRCFFTTESGWAKLCI